MLEKLIKKNYKIQKSVTYDNKRKTHLGIINKKDKLMKKFIENNNKIAELLLDRIKGLEKGNKNNNIYLSFEEAENMNWQEYNNRITKKGGIKMNILDDKGNEIKVGDFVIDYYNIADGEDSEGDRESFVLVEDQRTLGGIIQESDSVDRCVEKITKKDYILRLLKDKRSENRKLKKKIKKLKETNDNLRQHIKRNENIK